MNGDASRTHCKDMRAHAVELRVDPRVGPRYGVGVPKEGHVTYLVTCMSIRY